MPGIQRVGDVNSAGGVIQNGEPTVLVNFRPVATMGSKVSPHPPCPKGGIHCGASTTTKTPQILVNFKPITTSGTTARLTLVDIHVRLDQLQ